MADQRLNLPMVPLRGLTIMPGMIVHFDVSRESSIQAVQEAMAEEQKIFLVSQKSTQDARKLNFFLIFHMVCVIISTETLLFYRKNL